MKKKLTVIIIRGHNTNKNLTLLSKFEILAKMPAVVLNSLSVFKISLFRIILQRKKP